MVGHQYLWKADNRHTFLSLAPILSSCIYDFDGAIDLNGLFNLHGFWNNSVCARWGHSATLLSLCSIYPLKGLISSLSSCRGLTQEQATFFTCFIWRYLDDKTIHCNSCEHSSLYSAHLPFGFLSNYTVVMLSITTQVKYLSIPASY